MFLSYLRRHYKVILMLVLFVLIYASVFALYDDLPVEAVFYAGALCAAVGALFFVAGFLRYRKKHKALETVREHVNVSLDGLPPASGAVERDYQALLYAQRDERSRLEARAASEKRDLVDYYTLWAHQIKTPISAMRLLLQQGAGEENGALTVELFRIEQYVEMVLSYLRLDSESTDFVLRRCDLDEVVRGCIRKYARLFVTRKLPLEFSETGLQVLTDEKWLAFVIEQLLSNALKYTQSGKISIYAVGRTLVIRDTGIGISPEDLPRVFEKGYTGYNGREYKKSTGIGLYLCRRVCGKLGHRLTLESAPGVGTAARIDLTEVDSMME